MSWQSGECFSKDCVEDSWHLSSVFGTNRQEENSKNIMEIQSSTCYLVRKELTLQLHSDEQSEKMSLNEESECHFSQLLLLKCNPELWCKVLDKDT